MISGGDKLPDVLTFGVNATTAYEWGSEGVLVPLNDYFDNEGQYYRDLCASFGFDADDLLKQITSVDGNIYGTPLYMLTYNNMFWMYLSACGPVIGISSAWPLPLGSFSWKAVSTATSSS